MVTEFVVVGGTLKSTQVVTALIFEDVLNFGILEKLSEDERLVAVKLLLVAVVLFSSCSCCCDDVDERNSFIPLPVTLL